MYNEKVIEHFQNPRNVGEIENPDGVGDIDSPVCGDLIKVFIKVKDNIIIDVKYKTFGCAAAVASGSMMTELIKGKTIEEAMKITDLDVAEALGGLPQQKMHCSNLAAAGLHKAIEDYISKKGKKIV